MLPDEVSIVTPTFNQLPFLKQYIASLERQLPDPAAFEVVIVNDGSTDGTGDYLDAYQGPLRLEVIHLKENQGRSSARNRGIEATSGRLILFLDGDVVTPNDLVQGHSERHTGKQEALLGRIIYRKQGQTRAWTRFLERRGAVRLPPGREIPGHHFLTIHSSVPRDLLVKCGGFDESLAIYGEDIDLGFRLRKVGVRLSFAPELEVLHLHVRTLEESLKVAESFGRTTLPQLMIRYPEMSELMKFERITVDGWSGRWRRAALSRGIYRTALGLTKALGTIGAPPVLYSYLLYYHYYQGFQQRDRTRWP